MRTVYHVTKTENGWQGKREDRPLAAVKGTTKREVMAETIAAAKRHEPSSVRIHGVNGRIQEERTYPRSSDPRGSRG
jgi:hypothetical protein